MASTKAPAKRAAKRAAKPKSQSQSTARSSVLNGGGVSARQRTSRIKEYLQALDEQSKRGRKRNPESLRSRLESIQQRLDERPMGLDRLTLEQQRLDTAHALAVAMQARPIDELETDIIPFLAEWAEGKGISYTALRNFGVPTRVLVEAGVPRTRITTVT